MLEGKYGVKWMDVMTLWHVASDDSEGSISHNFIQQKDLNNTTQKE